MPDLTTSCKSTLDTVPYCGINGLSMIMCLWSPLHPLSKLLAIQDHAQINLEEQLWMRGRREVSVISVLYHVIIAWYLFKHVQWQLGWYSHVLKCKTWKIQIYKFQIIINCSKKLTFIAKGINLYQTSTVLRGALNEVLYGRVHAKVQPLTLLCIIKLRASILKWHPFLISIIYG